MRVKGRGRTRGVPKLEGRALSEAPTAGYVPASGADDHVGEWATVCGRVVEARYVPGVRGRPTFLNFEAPYPDPPFTAVIWGRVRARLDRPPEEIFEGEDVCVERRIDRHRGTPQIVVEDPGRIRVRDAAPPRRRINPTSGPRPRSPP